MENILSKKNCHRVSKVININEPDRGEWDFRWRGRIVKEGFMHTDYEHIAQEKTGAIVGIHPSDMKDWKVVEFKYEENMECLWDRAVRAFEGTSFSPEDRGASYIRDYEKALINDLSDIPEEEREAYASKFKEWVGFLFDKHSRIMSSMITGPARFPAARMEKANRSYEKTVSDFESWRNKAAKAIRKKIEDAKPEEQRANEAWDKLKRGIMFSATTIIGINNKTEKGFNKSLFVSSIYGKVKTYAGKGDVEMVRKAIDLIREVNKESVVITERHKFFKLLEEAEKIKQEQDATQNKDNSEYPFDGGVVVKNFEADRVQIIFDNKPDSETIQRLKKAGFRWSPRFSAWQRQLTQNGLYAVARITYIDIKDLKL